MDQKEELESVYPSSHISINSLFAGGIMSDYRSDWALADSHNCLEKKINTAQKES